MSTVMRLDEARQMCRGGGELTTAECKKLVADYGARADALEAAAGDALLFDTESMLRGLARRYRQLSHYLAENTPAA